MQAIALEVAPRARLSRTAYAAVVTVAGSLLIAGLAQISIKLSFTPVPITGQTLGVLLVGASLGPLLGVSSILLYIAEGAVGLPFFAGGESGWHGLFAPSVAFASAGYLWGFVLAGLVVGWLARRGWDRSVRGAIGAMLIGEILLYAVGILWLAAALNVPVVGTAFGCQFPAGLKGCDSLQLGLYPFLIGDLLKLLIAAGVLPLAWKGLAALRRRTDS
jgi:biotin transport system substrate-specific component